jgi:hypothetical protein
LRRYLFATVARPTRSSSHAVGPDSLVYLPRAGDVVVTEAGLWLMTTSSLGPPEGALVIYDDAGRDVVTCRREVATVPRCSAR